MVIPATPIAADARGLDSLKRTAREAPDKALRTAATQFEALFMNMILKGMRDASPKDGMLSSSAGNTYTGMLDQQLAQNMAGRGTGLADMLVRQLSPHVKGAALAAAGTAPATGSAAASPGAGPAATGANPLQRPLRLGATGTLYPAPARAAGTVSPALAPGTGPRPDPAALRPTTPLTPGGPLADGLRATSPDGPDKRRDFIDRLAEHARAAEQTTGVPARFMIGQAALETGWGKHEIHDSSGQSAHNLFGIKASASWSGPTVDVTTTEFVDGAARKVVARFRAYASYAEGFADYAKLLAGNPRYADALKAAGAGIASFAQGLQKAGYATDPAYAAKLTRVIGSTLRIDRQA